MMRKLIIKHFVLDWKFISTLPTLIGLIFIGAVIPAFLVDALMGGILALILITLFITGQILKYKNIGTVGISTVRPAFIIYSVFAITAIFMVDENIREMSGIIGGAIGIMLYFLPVLIKNIEWKELDPSQKWQLGSMYLEGANREGNPYMSDDDWKEWNTLNNYYKNKFKTVNYIL